VKLAYGGVAVVLVAVGIWATGCFTESEEKKVRRQFDRLSEWVSRDSEETIFTAVRKSRNVASVCADDCVVVAEDPSLAGAYGREDIARRTTQVRSSFTELRLQFYDLHIEMADAESANAVVTAGATGTTRYQEWVDETREVACTLAKTDGEWLFVRVEVVAVLER
jgi:hypothetical protein